MSLLGSSIVKAISDGSKDDNKYKKELNHYKKLYHELMSRVSNELSNSILKGNGYELSIGISTSKIIDIYDELYSQNRTKVMEVINQHDTLKKLKKMPDTRNRMVITILYSCFKSSEKYYDKFFKYIETVLKNASPSKERDNFIREKTIEIMVFLKKEAYTFCIDTIIKDTKNVLKNIFKDLEEILISPPVSEFINKASRLCWLMVTNSPKISIDCSSLTFDQLKHNKTHTSSEKSKNITSYIWPIMFETTTSCILYKGVVNT